MHTSQPVCYSRAASWCAPDNKSAGVLLTTSQLVCSWQYISWLLSMAKQLFLFWLLAS